MEENKRFSWTDLFIKIILVVIFILFTVWLLSLSTKGLSNSLDVLTNNIFSENMEKMKEVGKEYFTLERLPEKVGDIETLTLEEMYEKKLILELTDKDGNACSAEDSYVSIEKYDNEYQMKVYLECGEESDYIIVIMGCYDYCDTDICEFDKDKEEVKEIEYEYKKTTGGKWTDYGKWSEWSKVSVTNTDYRQVETKVLEEEYSYDKTITEVLYAEFEASCPSGYKMTADGTECYKTVTNTTTKDPVCSELSGWTFTGRDGFTCNYSKEVTETTTGTASCPSGYTQSGNTCIKPVTSTITKTASCPSGYTQSGSTCVESDLETATPVCPTVSGYTKTSQSGFTCSYKANNYTLSSSPVDTGDCYDVLPSSTSKYYYKQTSSTPKYVCLDGVESCAIHTYITYDVYEKIYATTTKTASCPSGYTKSGSTCVESNPDTKTPVCPTVSGYTKTSQSGFTCNYSKTTNEVKDPVCPTVSGYTKTSQSGFTCNYSKQVTKKTTETASCSSGYTKSGSECVKSVASYKYEDLIKTCPVDYKESSAGNNCYKEVSSTVRVTGIREVTYYRYRIREYVGGTVDYKWSKSKEDKELLNAGYKLTGRTR